MNRISPCLRTEPASVLARPGTVEMAAPFSLCGAPCFPEADMIGPAEIEDMMLDYAEAHAAAGEQATSELQSGLLSICSWGAIPVNPR